MNSLGNRKRLLSRWEPASATGNVAEAGIYPRHKIHVIRAMPSNRGAPITSTRAAHTLYDFGDLTRYISSNDLHLPRLLSQEYLQFDCLNFPAQISDGSAHLTTWAADEDLAIGVLSIEFDGSITRLIEMSRWLFAGRFQISDLELADTLREWLQSEREVSTTRSPEQHLLVIPASRLQHKLSYDSIQRIVYRVDRPARPNDESVVFPPQMNKRSYALCGHGPFVTVIAGQQKYLENACLLALVQVVASSESAHRIFYDTSALISSRSEDLTEISLEQIRNRVSERLAEIQRLYTRTALSVECRVDISQFIPSVRLGEYYESVIGSNQLSERLDTVLRLIERLESIVHNEREYAVNVQRSVDQARRRAWSGPLLALPAIAVPLTVITSILGANVHEVGEEYSVFNMRHFGILYLVTIVVTLLVLATGLLPWLRARKMARSPGRYIDHVSTR